MLLEIVDRITDEVLDTRSIDPEASRTFIVGDLIEFHNGYHLVTCTIFKRLHLLDESGLRLYVIGLNHERYAR